MISRQIILIKKKLIKSHPYLVFQVQEREAFGKVLASQGTILQELAQSRLEVEQARLLTLKAAHLMDVVGNKQARREIAMIKVSAPRMAQAVIDRAMQVSELSVVTVSGCGLKKSLRSVV